MNERTHHLALTNSIAAARKRLDQIERMAQADDIDAAELIAAANRLASTTAEITTAAVGVGRARGTTWSTIGSIFGVSKQAVSEKFRSVARLADPRS